MTDQPQQPEPLNSITNVSGGVNAKAEQINVGADVVGRDKIVHIEHYHASGEAAPSKSKIYHNLPRPDYVRFVGREEELAWLRERLSPEDRAWQIAITGIGGVGKSALALTIAHFYREHFGQLDSEERFEAIVWVSAKEQVLTVEGRESAAVAESVLRTLEDVYIAIAQTLDREDITRANPPDQYALVHKALHDTRTLLIMDNLESVTDNRVRPFLRKLPLPTKALITSREWLDVADILKLQGLAWLEANRLIQEEAVIRHIHLDEAQRKRLFDLTSGLPLALKLSVARMASGESFEAVTRWLGNAVGDVPEYCVQGQAELVRQRDPNAWRLLLATSLFDRGAGATREALGNIVDLSVADCDGGLAQLQRLFLANQTDNNRFWVLPIVQRYAGAQFAEGNESLIERWLTYYLNLLNEHERDRRGGLLTIQPEIDNVLNAIEWCWNSGRIQELIDFLHRIDYYLWRLGRFGDLIKYYELGVNVCGTAPAYLYSQAVFMSQLGNLRELQGDLDVARDLVTSAIEIFRVHNRKNSLAYSILELATIETIASNYGKARELAGEGLQIAEEMQSPQHIIRAHCRLAAVDLEEDRLDEAQSRLEKTRLYRESLAAAPASHLLEDYENWMSSLLYRLLGKVALRRHNHTQAREYLALSLDIAQKIINPNVEARAWFTLAELEIATGNPNAARQAANAALSTFTKLGMKPEVRTAQALLSGISEA